MNGGRSVAVVGPGETTDERLLTAAFEVGWYVGQHRALLVCGGLGGVMAAACRGAKEAGATTVGLLPGVDPAIANPWVDIVIPTGLGQARNLVVVRAAAAVVAVGGSWGTLSEVAFARRAGVPVVSLFGWRVRDGSDEPVAGVAEAADAEEALRLALG